jgi:hypothetical protein
LQLFVQHALALDGAPALAEYYRVAFGVISGRLGWLPSRPRYAHR